MRTKIARNECLFCNLFNGFVCEWGNSEDWKFVFHNHMTKSMIDDSLQKCRLVTEANRITDTRIKIERFWGFKINKQVGPKRTFLFIAPLYVKLIKEYITNFAFTIPVHFWKMKSNF